MKRLNHTRLFPLPSRGVCCCEYTPACQLSPPSSAHNSMLSTAAVADAGSSLPGGLQRLLRVLAGCTQVMQPQCMQAAQQHLPPGTQTVDNLPAKTQQLQSPISSTSSIQGTLNTFGSAWQVRPTAAGLPLHWGCITTLAAQQQAVGGFCSSSSRGFCSSSSSSGSPASPEGNAAAEGPRRRRRTPTESQAALRRTTESRAAIEDVAVMSKNQLQRRNKPWLAEQCWQHGLSHEGLKDDLIQRLLQWQGTDAGKAAAAEAMAAAAAARAAVAAAAAAAAGPMQAVPLAPKAAAAAAAAPSPASHDAGGMRGTAGGQLPPQQQQQQVGSPAPAAPAAAAQASAGEPGTPADWQQLARPAAGACAAAVALPADADDSDAADTDQPWTAVASGAGTNASTAAAAAAGSSHVPKAAEAAGAAAAVGWQAPMSAADAAARSIGLFLGQLQEQPTNAAMVAAARNAVEMYTQQLLSSASSSGTSSSNSSSTSSTEQQQREAVTQLAATVSQHSSPQSLAALAKACYSREVQNAVLAASLAEAVAAVAAQLGPQEVYGVLRLLVEHLWSEADDPVGFKTMDKGCRVLAEAMIRCSDALKPVQLAEAVELLGLHGYDDAFGLWMICKEAAARLSEFEPSREGGSVVQLLNAIANMCVADDAMTADVAAAVGARQGEYSQAQLAAIAAALQRMGYTLEL